VDRRSSTSHQGTRMYDHLDRTPTVGRILLALGLAAALAVPGGLEGQERAPAESIRSDRPGLGDGTWVVGSGVWQAEVGGAVESSGEDQFLTGSGLLRVGLEGLELRASIPGVGIARGEEDLILGDVAVGVKLPLAEQDGWTTSLMGGVSLPLDRGEGVPDDPGGSAALLAETALSDEAALALNLGYGFPFDDVDQGTFAVIATPSLALGDDVSAYAGWAGFFRSGDDTHIVEGGVAWLARPDLQWDVNAGFDPDTEVWFLGAGFATRW